MRVRIRGALRLTSALGAVTLAIGTLSAGTLAAGAATTRPAAAAKSGPKVLLVGTYHGKKGGYTSIQAAVNAARPGDWILVGPGDYHETADETTGEYGNPADGAMGGVFIHKNGITLRGMNRSTVIVDGTLAGASPCSSQPSEQNYGRVVDGQPVGRNGILVWKANDVSVENLTVCNFLAGTGDSGNEVWWNGGDNSGKIGETGYWGSYLTATSTFFSSENTAAEYGIFASNSAGPATWNQLYASNMNDSGTYVGACKQRCDMVMDHMWMENNALGYSGTNSGGTVVIENSQFDHNQDGLDTNTQIIGDPPAPQNGRCPHGRSRITHTTSCWVVIHNYIHNNNNNMAPAAGSAAAGPVGTGMTVSGGRFDTVMDNKIVNNGAWGVLFVPYAQSGTPSLHQTCAGVGGHEFPGFGCVMDPEGDALLHNWFGNDGYFHNPSNSDFGQITLFGGEPQNCFAGNRDPNGSAPGNLEKAYRRCGATTKAGNSGGELFTQVLCDTGLSSCPANAHYPKVGGRVVLKRVPRNLPTMPNPCAGVPANPWCPRGGQHWTGNGGTRTVAAALVMTGARAAARMQPGLFLFL